ELVADRSRVKMPLLDGLPCRIASPLPLSVKVTPAGSAPDSLRDGVGHPNAEMMNELLPPHRKVVLFGLVKLGPWLTVRVKFWWAFGGIALSAVSRSGKTPQLLIAGVPERVAVPSPLSWKLTPLGSAPDSVMVDTGCAGEVVTVKVPNVPAVNVT